MIRYKDIILENYSIDPVTAIITNSKGEIQKTTIRKNGYMFFKKMDVHKIQAHTNYGYKKDYDIHHIDENKMNNSLSNLVYLTKSEHTTLHKKGKTLSEDTKRKISESERGRTSPMKGKILSEEAKKKISKVLTGRTLSSETKQKLSEATKGENNPMYRKHLSEETKKKLSEVLKGRNSGEKNGMFGKKIQMD